MKINNVKIQKSKISDLYKSVYLIDGTFSFHKRLYQAIYYAIRQGQNEVVKYGQ